jgi:hypothetical protein
MNKTHPWAVCCALALAGCFLHGKDRLSSATADSLVTWGSLTSGRTGSTTLARPGDEEGFSGAGLILTQNGKTKWQGPGFRNDTGWSFTLQNDSNMCIRNWHFGKEDRCFDFIQRKAGVAPPATQLVVNDDGTMGLYEVVGTTLNPTPLWISSNPNGFGNLP